MSKGNAPLRKCIGCGEMKEKGDLIRVVKTPEGEMRMDEAKHANGRGAYLCKRTECLNRAIKSKGLERSFRCKVHPGIYEALAKEMERLSDETR